MNTISVSQLKTHPSKAIDYALDYPLAIKKRNQVKAYLIGKGLYEKIISLLEDHLDVQAIKNTDFSKGKDFEKVASDLGL